ncbi:hypothetical protein AHAS_Ahas10G0136100 [Arachis hypogaea]
MVSCFLFQGSHETHFAFNGVPRPPLILAWRATPSSSGGTPSFISLPGVPNLRAQVACLVSFNHPCGMACNAFEPKWHTPVFSLFFLLLGVPRPCWVLDPSLWKVELAWLLRCVARHEAVMPRHHFALLPVAGVPRPAFKWHAVVRFLSWRTMLSTPSGMPSPCFGFLVHWRATPGCSSGMPNWG